MRYRGSIKCSFPITSNAYHGTMGTDIVYKSFTEAFSYASTIIPNEWNEVNSFCSKSDQRLVTEFSSFFRVNRKNQI